MRYIIDFSQITTFATQSAFNAFLVLHMYALANGWNRVARL